MPPAPLRLANLRANPATECANNGFICRGGLLSSAIGGPCTLTCQTFSTVFQIDVAAGAGDWFIPFAQGSARYCDIPRGQPNGTLVVTFPMNGCALEVHRRTTGNRFYHDSDGNSMPNNVNANFANQVHRVTANTYEGVGARAAAIFAQHNDEGGGTLIGQNFEHTLICVKNGPQWDVYQTAVVTTIETTSGDRHAFQVIAGPPIALGSFND
jgi:hypothetical protein